MVEAACASIVLGLLAAATLSAVSSTVKLRQLESDRARARDLASGLLSEILSQRYGEPGVTTVTLGPEAGEYAGASRALMDDVDDYHGLSESPPRGTDGVAIPGFTGWTRSVTVVWVPVNTPSSVSAAETGLKRITVTITKGGRTLAQATAWRSLAWDKSYLTGTTVSSPVATNSVGSGS